MPKWNQKHISAHIFECKEGECLAQLHQPIRAWGPGPQGPQAPLAQRCVLVQRGEHHGVNVSIGNAEGLAAWKWNQPNKPGRCNGGGLHSQTPDAQVGDLNHPKPLALGRFQDINHPMDRSSPSAIWSWQCRFRGCGSEGQYHGRTEPNDLMPGKFKKNLI